MSVTGTEITIVNSDGFPARSVSQCLGPWLIEQTAANRILAGLSVIDMASREASGTDRRRTFATIDDRIALVELDGVMTKYGSSFGDGSTMFARKQLGEAARDDGIEAIVMRIDSPGGTVAGTLELSEAVAAAGSIKPMNVYFEDLGASAAYYVGCQGTGVYANEPCLIGSIGTMMTIEDSSKHASEDGRKILVVSSAELKGIGVPGTEVTDEHVAYLQEIVLENNELFKRAVKRGRGLTAEQLEKVATGAVFMATTAKSLGLIDDVTTFDGVIELTKEQIGMSGTPATIKDLRSALVGADDSFVIEQLEGGATLQEAQDAWTLRQNEQNEALQAKMVEVQAENESLQKAASTRQRPVAGIPPVGTANATAAASSEGPREKWVRLIREEEERGKARAAAVCAVNRANKGLREEMLQASAE